jgi:hypothetical protein
MNRELLEESKKSFRARFPYTRLPEFRGKLKALRDDMKGLEDLVGATVVDVGMTMARRVEGGLAIDYEKDGEKRRVVLGYTELGEWIHYQGPACK